MSSITVIIATYNRSALLRGALGALAAQQDPGVPVTIAVADNGSTDETRAVWEAARAGASRFDWTYLHEARPGKSHAVNAALAQTAGDWLALTDDDVRPEPGWLAAIAHAFATSSADFVVGRIRPIWEVAPPGWFSAALNGALGVPDNGAVPCEIGRGENEHVMPIGANMAVRRAAVDRVGGLHPGLGKMRGTLRTGEDHEFFVRLLECGCRGRYVPGAGVRHLVPAARLTRPYFRRWFYENGRNVATLEASWPARAPVLLGIPRYLWRQAAADSCRLLLAGARFDAAARFRRMTALLWFAGYVREAWFGPQSRAHVPGRPPEKPSEAGL